MKRILSAILAMAMILSMAACGSTTETEETNTESTTTTETTETTETEEESKEPEKEVPTVLRLSDTADIDTLDPMHSMLGSSGAILSLIYENLIEYAYWYDANGNTVSGYKGVLAEDWAFSDDYLTVTFNLKKGVLFQNGSEMKASDVVFSFQKAMESPSKQARMENIVSTEATDDYTVVVTLSAVTPAFLDNMCRVPIINEAYYNEVGAEEFGKAPMGTGPYKFVEHKEMQGTTVEAYEDYRDGVAAIKTVTWDIMADPASAQMAFEAGSFDKFSIALENVDTVEASGQWNLIQTDNYAPVAMYVNNSHDILGNVKVRQAIHYALNKDNMVTLAQDGKGSIADSFFHPELMTNTTYVDEPYTYNVEKAKELLADAGYANGEGLPTLKLITITKWEKHALCVQQDLAELGINVEIQTLEASTFLNDITVGNYDLAVNMAALSNLVYPWRMLYHSDFLGKTNFGQVNDPAIDELFNKLGATMSDDEQKAIIKELVNYINVNVNYVPLTYTTSVTAYHPDLVINGHPRSASAYDLSWAK